MANKIVSRMVCLALLAVLVLSLFGLAQATSGSNIDPTNKYAWSTNAGWINFKPTHGGVTVYADHLEGYAWAENIGWVRLGSFVCGGAHHYVNSTKDNYGVNRDATGHLSGYAWSTNAGWIRFDPTHGGVTIDPATGNLDGYAWGENIGWVHFAKPGVYGVSIVMHRIYLPIVVRTS